MIRRARRPSRACPGWPAVTKTGEISNVTSGENCSATHSMYAVFTFSFAKAEAGAGYLAVQSSPDRVNGRTSPLSMLAAIR